MQIDFDAISFAEWLIALNDHAAALGFKAEPLTQSTGQLCWYSYFEEAFTPEAALESAVADALAYGEDYLDTETERKTAHRHKF